MSGIKPQRINIFFWQQYDDAKVEEMVKMGMFPTKDFAYRVLYGEPLDEEAEEGILRKLRRDIAGRG